jgi:hypothetical protein
MDETHVPPTSDEPMEAPGADDATIRYALEQLRSEQNLPFALLAGAASAAVGAGAWAAITAATGYQIGFMAIGVGLLVGFAVRFAGKGLDPLYGAIGAVFALVGCAAGNLLTGCIFVAQNEQVALMQVLSALDVQVAQQIMLAMFSPMDLLFYGLAVYEGWRFSFRQLEG